MEDMLEYTTSTLYLSTAPFLLLLFIFAYNAGKERKKNIFFLCLFLLHTHAHAHAHAHTHTHTPIRTYTVIVYPYERASERASEPAWIGISNLSWDCRGITLWERISFGLSVHVNLRLSRAPQKKKTLPPFHNTCLSGHDSLSFLSLSPAALELCLIDSFLSCLSSEESFFSSS